MDRYKLIEDSNSERLVNDVNRAIAEGWVPQGGVVVVLKSHDQKQLRYVQAMFLPAAPQVTCGTSDVDSNLAAAAVIKSQLIALLKTHGDSKEWIDDDTKITDYLGTEARIRAFEAAVVDQWMLRELPQGEGILSAKRSTLQKLVAYILWIN